MFYPSFLWFLSSSVSGFKSFVCDGHDFSSTLPSHAGAFFFQPCGCSFCLASFFVISGQYLSPDSLEKCFWRATSDFLSCSFFFWWMKAMCCFLCLGDSGDFAIFHRKERISTSFGNVMVRACRMTIWQSTQSKPWAYVLVSDCEVLTRWIYRHNVRVTKHTKPRVSRQHWIANTNHHILIMTYLSADFLFLFSIHRLAFNQLFPRPQHGKPPFKFRTDDHK